MECRPIKVVTQIKHKGVRLAIVHSTIHYTFFKKAEVTYWKTQNPKPMIDFSFP